MLLICPVLLTITWNCRGFGFILWSGLSYVRVLTICLLLVYFVRDAGCHCFDLVTTVSDLRRVEVSHLKFCKLSISQPPLINKHRIQSLALEVWQLYADTYWQSLYPLRALTRKIKWEIPAHLPTTRLSVCSLRKVWKLASSSHSNTYPCSLNVMLVITIVKLFFMDILPLSPQGCKRLSGTTRNDPLVSLATWSVLAPFFTKHFNVSGGFGWYSSMTHSIWPFFITVVL